MTWTSTHPQTLSTKDSNDGKPEERIEATYQRARRLSPQGFGIPPAPNEADPARSSAHSTVSGPARVSTSAIQIDAATAKLLGTEAVAAAFPFKAAKASEYGENTPEPQAGRAVEPPPMVSGTALTEANASPKASSGNPQIGFNPSSASLDRVRADSGGQTLTADYGVPVADNQNSLKVGLRGPALVTLCIPRVEFER
jgi:catalase